MGTPTIGGTTTGSVTELSGIVITGDLDDVGFFTGNNDDTWTISSGATYGTATIDVNTGTWSYDLTDTHPAVKALDPGETLTDTFVVNMADATQGSDTQVITITINGAFCFADGTLIETDAGPVPVEVLMPGQLLRTIDTGFAPIRWIGTLPVSRGDLAENRRLRPVRIAAGALGPGQPTRDLRVSRQHRVLIGGEMVESIFGAPEMLVPAIQLAGLPGFCIDKSDRPLVYHHLLLDTHQIIYAEGAPCESFLTGGQAMATLTRTQRKEIEALLPETALPGHAPVPARPIPLNGQQARQYRKAMARHRNRALQAG